MPTESEAVGLLQELGLTEYGARCFVALSRVDAATATEISELSDVPRSRVYDAVDRLHRRGLVDVQQSEPREYRALAHEDALETLREQYDDQVDAAREALGQLERTNELEEAGAWAIADHDHVTDRATALLEDATEEAYVLIADDTVIEPDVLKCLASVHERGVSVTVEVATEDAHARATEILSDEIVAVTELAGAPAMVNDHWLGRILMVDRYAVMLSALQTSARPNYPQETAIWAKGPDHGLLVGVTHLLGARVDKLFE